MTLSATCCVEVGDLRECASCRHLSQIHRSAVQGQLPRFGIGQCAQVFDKTVEQQHLLVDRFEVVGREGEDAVLHRFNRPLDAG
ncbi:MAG: hypothetical protein R2856_29850 [Caldilineaceae bacterium]